MEVAIAIAVTVGPLALLLVGLALSLRPRRRQKPHRLMPPWQGPFGGRGGKAGDRSPNRPRVPTLSGGAALDVPVENDLLDEPVGPTRIAG